MPKAVSLNQRPDFEPDDYGTAFQASQGNSVEDVLSPIPCPFEASEMERYSSASLLQIKEDDCLAEGALAPSLTLAIPLSASL